MADDKKSGTPPLPEEHKELRSGLKKGDGKVFRRKTIWEWVTVLLTPILIPIIVAGGGWWLSAQQDRRDQDNRQEDILKTYLDNMSDLMINHGLSNSKQGDVINNIARGQTLVAIQRLKDDKTGKASKARILEFLHEVKLINKSNPIILMHEAWLDGADMSATRSDLSNDNLEALALNHANLSGVAMIGTDLSCTRLLSQ